MASSINVQSTPNPQALKFILNQPVAASGAVTYRYPQECGENLLAKILLGLEHVKEVYFCDNFITITQDGREDWDVLESKVQTAIQENIALHRPEKVAAIVSEKNEPAAAAGDSDLATINAILDRTVRPFLQRDGGDLQIVEFKDNVLKINYQGACGGCPSAAYGTLRAIENVLREQYRPDVVVKMA